MYFDLSISIDRPPEEVFGFLRDKDKYPQEPGSPVLALDQTTPGSAGVGTRYREVVRMLPLVRREIHSVITDFEPSRHLGGTSKARGWSGTSSIDSIRKAVEQGSGNGRPCTLGDL